MGGVGLPEGNCVAYVIGSHIKGLHVSHCQPTLLYKVMDYEFVVQDVWRFMYQIEVLQCVVHVTNI